MMTQRDRERQVDLGSSGGVQRTGDAGDRPHAVEVGHDAAAVCLLHAYALHVHAGVDRADPEAVDDERGDDERQRRGHADEQGAEADREQRQPERRGARPALGDHAGDDAADARDHGDEHQDAGEGAVADVELVLDPRGLRHDRGEHEALQGEAGSHGDARTPEGRHGVIVGPRRVAHAESRIRHARGDRVLCFADRHAIWGNHVLSAIPRHVRALWCIPVISGHSHRPADTLPRPAGCSSTAGASSRPDDRLDRDRRDARGVPSHRSGIGLGRAAGLHRCGGQGTEGVRRVDAVRLGRDPLSPAGDRGLRRHVPVALQGPNQPRSAVPRGVTPAARAGSGADGSFRSSTCGSRSRSCATSRAILGRSSAAR